MQPHNNVPDTLADPSHIESSPSVRALADTRWSPITPSDQPTTKAPAAKQAGRRTFRITRTIINFWLDVSLALLLLTQLWISFVLRFAFPPGPEAAGWSIWSWSYETWFQAQFTVACVLAGAVVLHVMLHWSWVCGVVTRWFRRPGSPPPEADDPVRTLVGVMLLIAILVVMGVGLAAAVFSVTGPA